jgi:4-hydroxybenzoate polyprenyltransferase
MIKFEHTVFALPFAFAGAFLAAGGFPGWWPCLWILLSMIGARTVAMGINRLADLKFDAANPRTSKRPLVTGEVKTKEAWTMVLMAGIIYFISAYMLTPLAFLLSPFVLFIIVMYSYTKRFTSLCHLFLGLAIGIAPSAGWIAIKDSISIAPLMISAGVMFWVAGFDILYACQDEEFDRKFGLHSIPAAFGTRKAFTISGIFHFVAFCFFTTAGVVAGLDWIYFTGIAATFVLLVLQRRILTPDDLSRMDLAFFKLNGAISIILFASTALSLVSISL